MYEEAAAWYERFARETPKRENAAEALQDAVLFRLGLGQDDRAIEDADRFVKAYGASRPAQAAAVAFAIGAHHVDREDWVLARKRLSGAMGTIDRDATLDVQMQAHAILGRALEKLGNATDAASEYGKVRTLWRDPQAATRRIMESGDERRLVKALTVAGEAAFFFAEEKARTALAIKLPAYRGPGYREDVARYFRTEVVGWIAEKRKAIEETEKAYLEVASLKPLPSPRWMVASSARVAELRGRLATELSSAPAPAGWKKQGASPWGRRWEDVWADWRVPREAAGAPLLASAKAANRLCVELSVKYQWTDEGSRACGTWLTEHYPAEYPRIDELGGKPVGTAFAIESQPVPAPATP
jgi:hypothetical protein